MVQNSIIVASPYHLHHNYTGSFLSQITYSWTSATASVYPPDRPTTLPPTYPSFNLSLLPGSDTKEVTSTPQIIPPPPYLRYVFHTFTLRLKTGLVLSSVTLFHPNNLPTPYKTLDPPSLHCFQYPTPPPPLHDLNPTKKTIADLDFTTTHIQLNINYEGGTCQIYTSRLLLTYVTIQGYLSSHLYNESYTLRLTHKYILYFILIAFIQVAHPRTHTCTGLPTLLIKNIYIYHILHGDQIAFFILNNSHYTKYCPIYYPHLSPITIIHNHTHTHRTSQKSSRHLFFKNTTLLVLLKHSLASPFLFFWSGLQCPKAYSLWGVVVPSRASAKATSRLWPYL